jgi:hypothetical protein
LTGFYVVLKAGRRRFAAVLAAVSALSFGLTPCEREPAVAAEPLGAASGSVQTMAGQPIAATLVTFDGPISATVLTDERGTFSLSKLPAGTYSVRIVKAGFDRFERDGVVIRDSASVALDATLAPSSFSSLRTIGYVSTNTPGRSPINTTTAAFALIPSQTFLDQGQLALPHVLSEFPGVITTVTSDAANGASPGSLQVPQIRGALPYETASLIDGHPVSVGSAGSFTPLLVNPALLQDIEVVKGPGAAETEINYAIGGSINYRTLSPTERSRQSYDLGIDGYGGVNTAARATGSLAGDRIGYAFAFATNGSPGPLQDDEVAGSQLALLYGNPPWTINGRQVAGTPLGVAASNTPQFAGTVGAARYAQPLYVCCSAINTGYKSGAQLAKVRFNFSQQSTLTLSFLSGQALSDLSGADANSLLPVADFSTFAPPAGYTGSVPAGTPIPFDTVANAGGFDSAQQNLFQSEFRTALGGTTILARFYSGYSSSDVYSGTLGAPQIFTESTWGGIALCPTGTTLGRGGCTAPGAATVAPVMTYFNGQPATFMSTNSGSLSLTQDHLRGFSVQANREIGEALFSVALDRSNHDSWEYDVSPTANLRAYALPPGSGQRFTTVLGRALVSLAPRLTTTVSDYVVQYASHYTGDGGATWSDATHAFNVPRFGISWRPSADTAVRLALGGSIAPPFISLLSAPGGAPQANVPGGATYYVQDDNDGAVRPETAFGYDAGLDRRVRPWLTLSGDVYLTTLRDQFLAQTSVQGTYTPSSGADAGNTEPLYVEKVGNLGHARYEGVELAFNDAPPAGFGFVLQGSLQRAYPYDLPAGFYSTPAGPYTTNLAIVPNVNFQPSGLGYDGLSERVPYSQGYAELNYRLRSGSSGNIGVTYYGPNNQFNEPAFGVVQASVRVPAGARTWIGVSAYNLTGAYDAPYYGHFGGVPVALINGSFGASRGYLGPTPSLNVGPTTVSLSVHYGLAR